MSDRELELQNWWREACPLFEFMGLTVESVAGGIYRCKVPLTRDTANHLRTMHAAVQMAVSEVLGGIVAMSVIPPAARSTVFGAVRSVSIEYLRPARTDLTAEARFDSARAEGLLRSVAAGDDAEFDLVAEVRDTAGVLVARAAASYVLRPWRRE